MKKLICNKVARCQPASFWGLWKKLFHTFSFMYLAFIFSERITITSSEEALKVCEHNFIQEILAKSSVTCNLPVRLQFIQVNFLHVGFGFWCCLEYCFGRINWNSLTLLSFCLVCLFWYVLFKIKTCLPSWWQLWFYFNNNLNVEEMITSHLMCQLHYENIINCLRYFIYHDTFLAESGIYLRQSNWLLFRTILKTPLKPQKL